MHLLTEQETEMVAGGNPAVVFVAGALVGGLIYDTVKAAYKHLKETEYGETTGGNMQRGR